MLALTFLLVIVGVLLIWHGRAVEVSLLFVRPHARRE